MPPVDLPMIYQGRYQYWETEMTSQETKMVSSGKGPKLVL